MDGFERYRNLLIRNSYSPVVDVVCST